MGSLLLSLLLVVVVIAAGCRLVGSARSRRTKRRGRGLFVLGFGCGLVAGLVVRRRHRGLGAAARFVDRHYRPARIRSGPYYFAVDTLTIAASQAARRLPSTARRGRAWVHGR